MTPLAITTWVEMATPTCLMKAFGNCDPEFGIVHPHTLDAGEETIKNSWLLEGPLIFESTKPPFCLGLSSILKFTDLFVNYID